MNVPQLRMESTFAQLGLSTERGRQQIQQPAADLSIRQRTAQMNISRTPGRLTIDQTKAWEDMGLKSARRSIEAFAGEGVRAWMQGMARTSRQGDELMRIENGGDPISRQAKENSEPPIYETNIGWVPSPFSVKTNYDPGHLKINWQTFKPDIRIQPNKPIHHYTPGKVTGYIKQPNDLKIEVVGIDQKY